MKLQDLVKLKPIIEAIENGKHFQYNDRGTWMDIDYSCHFDVNLLNYYRIKKEPREFYIHAETMTAMKCFCNCNALDTSNGVFIKVREVI